MRDPGFYIEFCENTGLHQLLRGRTDDKQAETIHEIEDSDEEDDYDLDEDFFSEKETSSLSFDMSEIQKVRDSMQGTGNAHTLSEILGAFTVKHWRFSPFRRTPFFFTALLFFQIALGIYVIARLFDFGK